MKYLLFLFLFLIGCAQADVPNNDQGSDHPVYDLYGPHNKSEICAGIEPIDCQDYYEENFKNQLLNYYGGSIDLFQACDSNPYMCRDELATESWMRNIRSHAKSEWGW